MRRCYETSRNANNFRRVCTVITVTVANFASYLDKVKPPLDKQLVVSGEYAAKKKETNETIPA